MRRKARAGCEKRALIAIWVFRVTLGHAHTGTLRGATTMTINITQSSGSFIGAATGLTLNSSETVNVNDGSYLVSTTDYGINTTAASSSYTLNVDGYIFGSIYGVRLGNAANSLVDINVGLNGSIHGLFSAIFLSVTSTNLNTSIENKGIVSCSNSFGGAIYKNTSGSLSVNNEGFISSQNLTGAAIATGFSAAGTTTIINSGRIDSAGGAVITAVLANTVEIITNSGSIGHAGTASTVSLGAGIDKITNTGNGIIHSGVNMGDGTDTYIGGLFTDSVNGDLGADGISGNGGADFLRGGDGADKITGGAGRDWLWGWDGTGANDGDVDTFYYNALSDSGITGATRDVIRDFVRLSDKINLVNIDANDLVAGNQAFGFNAVRGALLATGQLGYKFEDVAGTVNDKTIISVNTDADAAIEFSIEMTGLKYLSATDFFL
jgi:hypothetical protein